MELDRNTASGLKFSKMSERPEFSTFLGIMKRSVFVFALMVSACGPQVEKRESSHNTAPRFEKIVEVRLAGPRTVDVDGQNVPLTELDSVVQDKLAERDDREFHIQLELLAGYGTNITEGAKVSEILKSATQNTVKSVVMYNEQVLSTMVFVHLDRDNELFVNNAPVKSDELQTVLSRMIEDTPIVYVHFRAHRGVNEDVATQVLDAIKAVADEGQWSLDLYGD